MATTSKTRKTTKKKTTTAKKTAKTTTAKKTAKKAAKKTTTKKAKAVKTVATKKSTKTATAKKTAKKATSLPTRAPAVVEESTAVVASPTSAMAEAMFADMATEDAAMEREAAREERLRDLLDRLAVSTNRYDEMPNLELAAEIVFNMDREAVSLLVEVLARHDDVHGPDAGRVLAEVGTRDEELIETELAQLVGLIDYDNLEMLSAVMRAISPLAHRVVDELWEYRDLFWQVINEGQEEADSAQAAAVRLLSAMCAAGPDYARTLAGGLVDLLGKCLPRDVALYAEAVLPALGSAHSHRAKPVLDRRMKELTPAEVARLRRAVRMAQTGQQYPAAA